MGYSESAYRALVGSIFRRFPSVRREGFTAGAYKPGLERMRAFCAALGHPERRFRSIHVAGTNGKGSVSSMLASAIGAAGCRTGLYTSPHLVDFRERMKVLPPDAPLPGRPAPRTCSGPSPAAPRPAAPGDGPAVSSGNVAEMVSREYVYGFLTRWEPYLVAEGLSFFEITTGMAFRWFADEGVEVAVLETGLGGRLDSTNVVTPLLSVVTSIGLDHCDLLGGTLAEIAGEKAGIFKPGVPALVGETRPETASVFDAAAARLGCSLTYADRVSPTLWADRDALFGGMDLQGPTQGKNLRTALAALDLLRPVLPCRCGAVDGEGPSGKAARARTAEALSRTAERTGLRGRWERVSADPEVICDIGHNADALRDNFARLAAAGRPLVVVYGIMADKDLDAILPLMPRGAAYVFTAASSPRALPAVALLARYQAVYGTGDGSVAEPTVAGALSRAAALAARRPHSLTYIGGSAYVVAEALPLLGSVAISGGKH